MILIIDSGSTKSDFIWIKKNDIRYKSQTTGINPFYQKENDILATITNACPIEIREQTKQVYFYGAGCSFKEKCDMVQRPLQEIFSHAIIEVHNDLLGAARSLFQHNEGIACILGTGSNSCQYNGNGIVKNVSPLGFILGDEGSGAVLGKNFIGDILKGLAPIEITERFFQEENISPAVIMDKIYKQPFPNRFLAQFSKHIYQYKKEPYFHQLLITCFKDFFFRNISQYPESLAIGLIGSIAYYFQEELLDVARQDNRTITIIEKSPIDGLIKYHQ